MYGKIEFGPCMYENIASKIAATEMSHICYKRSSTDLGEYPGSVGPEHMVKMLQAF